MERKKLDRALGPYSYPDKFMVTVIPAEITGNKGRQTKSFTFKEYGGREKAEAKAKQYVEDFNEQAKLTAGTTVEEALEAYPVFLAKPRGRSRGNDQPSIRNNMRAVRNVLDDGSMALQDIDGPYLAEREQARRDAGAADATVINEIKATCRFLAYCESRKLIRFNPLQGYYVAGNRNRGGKGFKQPNLDDLPVLREKAIELAEAGDEGALAVAVALQTGLRVTKLLTRRARNVDLQGFALKVPPEGRRPVNKNHPYVIVIESPRVAALLQRQAKDRAPDDYLFESRARGPHASKSGHRCRNWLAAQVRRVCRAAGVSDDTHAHGLRGAFATMGMISGEALEVLRQKMGHSPGSSVTTDAYAMPGSQGVAVQRKVLGN